MLRAAMAFSLCGLQEPSEDVRTLELYINRMLDLCASGLGAIFRVVNQNVFNAHTTKQTATDSRTHIRCGYILETLKIKQT